MTESTARLIVQAAHDLAQTGERESEACERVRLYENYSGRGMMGRTTTAIVYPDISTMNLCLIQAAYDLADNPTADREQFLRDVEHASHDQLGRERLIY